MKWSWENLKEAALKPGAEVRLGAAGDGTKAFSLARLFTRLKRPLAILTPEVRDAARWLNDLSFFLPKDNVTLFPPHDALPYYQLSSNPDTTGERLNKLYQLIYTPNPFITIIPMAALARKTMPLALFRKSMMALSMGEVGEREALIRKLVAMGYERVPLVEDRGSFAVRGAIVDLFSPSMDMPVRVEYFGDTIESLRYFEPSTQKTKEKVAAVSVIPAQEILFDALDPGWKTRLKKRADEKDIPKPDRDYAQDHIEKGIFFKGIETFLPFFYPSASTLFDYLPANSLIVLDDESRLLAKADSLREEMTRHFTQSQSPEKLVPPEELLIGRDEIAESLSLLAKMNLSELDTGIGIGFDCHPKSNHTLAQQIQTKITSSEALSPLVEKIKEKQYQDSRVMIVSSTPSQRERIKDLLSRYNVPLRCPANDVQQAEILSQALDGDTVDTHVNLLLGHLSAGFDWEDENQWWVTDEEIFGRKGRKPPTRKAEEVFTSFSELAAGQYVVHLDHGVGIYRGLFPVTVGKAANDFLLLEYLGGDKLYVPVDRLNRISRYNAMEGLIPLLDKMGGTTWQKVKDKVKKATRKLARQLLELQALRQSQRGFPLSPPDAIYEEFEATFPYEETTDQLRAIEDVISDLQKERPMDRLVCGDVGYGKTEVAIRAAFKAVLDKKQVAVLVPTTVLAFQHFETFKKRFAPYPVNVEMLSRFKSPKEQKEVVEKIKRGAVDVVIATHRLLSPDISFPDLGLLVIDEEHRFGVIQKEKIKKLKSLVHVLTLSATPIPRTLNFALVGIRDLSLISTPPADRLSVKTFVTHFDDASIREAVMHEVKRGGQVYFLHNRVQTMDAMKDRLSRILPEVKIGVAHGQMNEEQLEEMMIGFMDNKFDLLLCSTIIESGLDIPNANTLIINRADHLGLAQLYQLRGRVGRSHHRAYCYLLVPNEELITEDAQKRLNTIQRFSELGSGFKIANADLELRGAGNILGDEQSGNIAAIGYDLYAQLLKQAVQELQGRTEEEDIDPELKLNVEANIPADLVTDTSLRLVLYKQLSGVEDIEALKDLRDEWTDRLGALPEPILNLIYLMQVKILARQLRVVSLSQGNGIYTFIFHPTTPVSTDFFLARMKKTPKKYRLLPEGKWIVTDPSETDAQVLIKLANYLAEMIDALPQS